MDNYKQKISHLKALYHLANADNYYSKVEATYIKVVAEKLGVSVAELEKFDTAEPELDLPDKEYELFSMFHRLAIIIMIDNTLDENERKFCFNLGIKMGLHPNAINEIIDHVIAKGSMGAQPRDIIAIFKKYMS